MLACAQDLFFQQPSTTSTNDHPFMSVNNKESKRQHQLQKQSDHLSNKEKDEQQVWPPDVEGAFVKALETIPKLGRRKILVNGKPCGRNELISDFIFRKTGKIRTRKQVSSHIQVLKNTRKGDPHFMRLLTDSVEADEGYVSTTVPPPPSATSVKKQNKGMRRVNKKSMAKYHNTAPSNESMTTTTTNTTNSSLSCSPSPPIDYSVFDLIYQQSTITTKDHPFYDPFLNNTAIADIGGMTATSSNSSFSSSSTTTTTIISPISLNQDDLLLQQLFQQQQKDLISTMMMSTTDIVIQQQSNKLLWPNYICLYLEYSLPYDPSIILPHTLANLPCCQYHQLPTIQATTLINQGKCPLLSDLVVQSSTILSAKVGLNLNLNMTDFYFNNTSFFETQDRRTIECTTTIYSFGNVVLESKEIQQALWINQDKYMYSFVYVNQFFDAFIKGIRSLQSWQEVDIAINNLCVVQVFHDVEEEAQEPLLVMMYEFERGEGTMEVSIVETASSSQEQVTEAVVPPVENEEEFDFLAPSNTVEAADATAEL